MTISLSGAYEIPVEFWTYMATKRDKAPSTKASTPAPSRRAVIKKGVAVVGAGLVTTVAARDARAAGSWGGGGGGGNSGGGRGNSGGGRGNSGGGRGNSGGGRGRGRGR